MNRKQVKERMAELERATRCAPNDAVSLLEIALFIEEVFGIFLSDDDICNENLGTRPAIEKFVLEKLNSR